MPPSSILAPLATVAGTASTQPHALHQQLTARWATVHGQERFPLQHWTAQAHMALPAGTVYWLPTPAQAPTEERALEQACRSQWMASMGQNNVLRLLYGNRPHQLEALWRCLQDARTTQAARSGDAARTIDLVTLHGHRPGLRCIECVDPSSEQRLFSRLLQKRAER